MSSNKNKVIVGLGNPGQEYELTRHNAGFLALDKISAELNSTSCVSKFDAKICEAHLPIENGIQKILLVYPQTYMNDSGRALRQVLDFYKLGAEDILVLHDEVDLPIGTIKFTESSGSAGHNGVKSLIETLGTKDFARIRIGVESRANKDELPTDAFVLQRFAGDEIDKIPWSEITRRAIEWVKNNK